MLDVFTLLPTCATSPLLQSARHSFATAGIELEEVLDVLPENQPSDR